MNETEYLATKNAARAVAAEATVEYLANLVRLLLEMQPAASRSAFLSGIQEKIDAAKANFLQMAIKGVTPEWSDLIAAEFQDAFDELTKKLKETLGVRS